MCHLNFLHRCLVENQYHFNFLHQPSIQNNIISAFYTNPQYKISVPEPDDDDEDGNADGALGRFNIGHRPEYLSHFPW